MFSCVWLFVTLWTIALQAPLSMGFLRQENWSGLPFPSPKDLPDPRMETASPILVGRFFTTEPPGEPLVSLHRSKVYAYDCWGCSLDYLVVFWVTFIAWLQTWLALMTSESPQRDPALRTSLAVQWLRLCASAARDMGSILGQGTTILHAMLHSQKN